MGHPLLYTIFYQEHLLKDRKDEYMEKEVRDTIIMAVIFCLVMTYIIFMV